MIILRNDGEIDLEVITTMGVNVKENDSPIGYFGTGLKFAIATFLRAGIEFCMYRGIHKYTFKAIPKTIRGKVFKKCYMYGPFDSIDLGFTTDLGRNWEVWQAYREIHSNCLDENGEIFEQESVSSGDENCTMFVIETPIEVNGVFLEKTSNKKLFSNKKLEIYEGQSGVIYYQGIRARDLINPSIYTYNILMDCLLTEDRSICYEHEISELIADAVSEMDNKEIIKTVITAPPKTYENGVRPSTYLAAKPRQSFIEVCNGSLKKVNSCFIDHLQRNTPMPEKTPAEKKISFLAGLQSLCDLYEVNIHELNDHHGEYKELRGGILEEQT